MLLIMSVFLLRYRGIPSGSLGFQRNHEKTEERGLLHNVKTSFFCVYDWSVYLVGICSITVSYLFHASFFALASV